MESIRIENSISKSEKFDYRPEWSELNTSEDYLKKTEFTASSLQIKLVS